MDAASELSQFLTSRRAKVTPEQAGLPRYGQRRVPGLRREEVASLAGVSVEYYKRLERGNATGASDQVLEALADALKLDDAERAHLFDLARAAGRSGSVSARRPSRPVQQRVRPAVQRIDCTTLQSASSSSATRSWSSPRTRNYASRSSPPNPAPAPSRPPTSSPAGPPPRTNRPASIRPPTTPTARNPAPHSNPRPGPATADHTRERPALAKRRPPRANHNRPAKRGQQGRRPAGRPSLRHRTRRWRVAESIVGSGERPGFALSRDSLQTVTPALDRCQIGVLAG